MPTSVFVTGGAVQLEGTLSAGLVRPDGDLSFALLAFHYEVDGVRQTYDGSVNNSITDNSWNYIYLDYDGSLNVNTTGFPTTTHIRLAKLRAQNGAIVTQDDERVFLAAGIDKDVHTATAEAQDSTTSADWQQKLRLNLTDINEGTYVVQWYCELRHSNNDAAERSEMQIEVGDTTQIGYSIWPYNLFEDNGGFAVYDFSAGSYTIDLDYRQQGGGTAYIRRARLLSWRIA
jgi:hypothetical protein